MFRVTHKSYSPAFSQGWHEHEEATIDFVLAGAGEGTYAGRRVVSRAGAVEYFAPGLRHRFHSAPSGIRSLHIVLPAAHIREMGIAGDVLVRELDGTRLTPLALEMLREVSSPGSPDPLVLESLASQMTEEVGPRRPEPLDGGAWVGLVRELLWDEPQRARSLRAIADAVGLHPAHVARHFRRQVGVTVGEFGRRVRLTRAARALASEPASSLAGVALDHGFADQAHFTRCFKAAHGCTPREFRRRLGARPRA